MTSFQPTLPGKPTQMSPIRAADPGVANENLPDFLDKICKQHSVTFTEQDDIRQKQAFPYMSQEWETFHRHARNSIESLNAGVKDTGREAIEEPSRRRVRGFAAAQIFVATLLTNYNLRRIADFLHERQLAESAKLAGKDPTPRVMRRRDREWYNPYTKTTPRGLKPPLPRAEPAGTTPLRT